MIKNFIMKNYLYINIFEEKKEEEKKLWNKKKKEKILYKYLIKLFFISILLSCLSLIYFKIYLFSNNNSINNFSKAMQKNYKNLLYKKKENDTKVGIVEENFDPRELSFNKSYKFLKMSMEGILIQDKSKFISLEKPKASAVIPVYNSKNFISRAVKTIQNQNLLELEIILINDFSTDDTLSYIENFQKEDSRIKIIKNQKNMGIFHSKINIIFKKYWDTFGKRRIYIPTG